MRIFLGIFIVGIGSLAHESIPEAPLWVLKELYSHLPAGFYAKEFSEGGQGVASSYPVYSQQSCLCVDKSLFISPDDNFPLSRYITHLSDTQKLIVRTMYEKLNSTDSSITNKFLQSLSSEFLHPGSFARPHLKFFRMVNFHTVDVDGFIEAEIFTEIFRALEKIQGLDEEMLKYSSYIWAAFHVNSKKISVKDKNGKDTIGLIPFIDLVSNYPKRGLGVNNSLQDTENKICVICSWDSKPGERLVRDYGKISTLQYFLTYGKIFEDNPYDYFNLTNNQQDYILNTEEINKDLLESVGNGINGAIKYRKTLLTDWSKDKMGIREIRRKISPIQDPTVHKILKYGVEIRKTFYKHLKIVDQFLLGEIFHKIVK